MCQKLKYFEIDVAFHFDYFHILLKLQNLTTLEIGFISEEFQYDDCLPQNLMPNMTKIRIHSMGVTFANIEEDDQNVVYRNRRSIFLALAKACPNLKTYLIRSDYERLSSEFFQDLVKHCTKLEELKYLLLEESIKLYEVTAHFMLNNLTSLRLLDLKVL